LLKKPHNKQLLHDGGREGSRFDANHSSAATGPGPFCGGGRLAYPGEHSAAVELQGVVRTATCVLYKFSRDTLLVARGYWGGIAPQDFAMTFTRSNPLYPVADVAASIKWYRGVCGFEARFVHEDAHGPNYAVLYRDTVSMHLVRATEAQHGVKSPTQAQWWVDQGLDDLFENAKRLEVLVLQPIQEQPWGHRDFLLQDPDKNVVWITQPLPELR
jgi:uncharacterized glyoxalase superfamily protein PhnB